MRCCGIPVLVNQVTMKASPPFRQSLVRMRPGRNALQGLYLSFQLLNLQQEIPLETGASGGSTAVSMRMMMMRQQAEVTKTGHREQAPHTASLLGELPYL